MPSFLRTLIYCRCCLIGNLGFRLDYSFGTKKNVQFTRIEVLNNEHKVLNGYPPSTCVFLSI